METVKVSGTKVQQNERINAPNKVEMLEAYLKGKYNFRYNEILNRVEQGRKGVDEYRQVEELTLLHEVNRYHRETGKEYLSNLLGSRHFSPSFNPLKAWLATQCTKYAFSLVEASAVFENLSSYLVLVDKTEEAAFWLQTALKKWFVGAIKTLNEEDYVHKSALVFVGPSGIGKTFFVNSFLPAELKYYVTSNPNLSPDCKDSRISLTTNLVIIINEIDKYFEDKKNRDNYKHFTSQISVKERLPYDRVDTFRTRICSFLATCNESNFLNDPTGSQRFTSFDVEYIKNKRRCPEKPVELFDMRALWAAAETLYRAGFDPEYSMEEVVYNEKKNERFKFNSAEYETLQEYLVPSSDDDVNAEFMTSSKMCLFLNAIQNGIVFQAVPLGKALTRLGLKRSSHKGIYGYWVRRAHLPRLERPATIEEEESGLIVEVAEDADGPLYGAARKQAPSHEPSKELRDISPSPSENIALPPGQGEPPRRKIKVEESLPLPPDGVKDWGDVLKNPKTK